MRDLYNFAGIIGIVALSVGATAKTPPQASFVSGEKQTHLLELFSTESCSSCPPADRWVSSLRKQSQLWKSFVPVVYHVDYWDYIGWKDPYSSSEFTKKQRRYARLWGSRTVYTPGFVLNGNEWKSRDRSALASASKKAPGVLKVNYFGSGRFEVSFTPKGKAPKRLKVHAAILGNGIKTNVRKGENSGRTLPHDFLTLGYQTFEVVRNEKGYSGTYTIKERFKNNATSKSLAVWISTTENDRPIQVVGGDLVPKEKMRVSKAKY